jgi:histidine triad (HIT) family protein
MECIFCKIAKGEMDSYVIYEDEIVKAILDINPASNGHTLILPKKHYKDLDDIDEKTITHVMMVAKKVKKILEDKLSPIGITLIQNNGKPQEIKHFHLHLKPCYEKGTRKIKVEKIIKKITE